MNKKIETPSVEVVQKYIDEFNNNREFVVVEDTLSELFRKYPRNQSLQEILIKSTVLNSLYNTNIYAIVKMADHILNKNMDSRLQVGSLELVAEIAYIEIEGKIRNNYSFASKYCHWHKPDIYPIYDSYIDQLLWQYQKQGDVMRFTRAALRDYPRYKEIVESFRKKYGLVQFSFKELDKFLWMRGKEFLKKPI